MIEIIRTRERVERATYYRCFDREDQPGSGWSFPCDEHGNVDVASLAPAGKENWDECVTNTKSSGPVVDRGVETITNYYTRPAIGRCDCGSEVALSGFTNTCECGADYNMSGSRLAPREQWGEETGESLSDILQIP